MATPQIQDRLANYVPVSERIEQFYSDNPKGRILTAIIEHSAPDGFILMRAEVYREGEELPAATGHAFENRSEGYVNKTSYLENCETSAVGRALALLGYEIKRGIASREEMEKVDRMTQIKAVPTEKETLMEGVQQACKLLNQAGEDPPFTPARLKEFIKTELGAASIDDLGLVEVRELIKRLSLRVDSLKQSQPQVETKTAPDCDCGIARVRVDGKAKTGPNKGQPYAMWACANRVKEHKPIFIDLDAEAEEGEVEWLRERAGE